MYDLMQGALLRNLYHYRVGKRPGMTAAFSNFSYRKHDDRWMERRFPTFVVQKDLA